MSNSNVWADHKPDSGSGDYLKLRDGDKKKVRFYSEPAIVTYDGVKIRYQVVLYNKTDKVAQIYEFGPQVFGQVSTLGEDWGLPDEFDMHISRQGSTQFDTSYTVSPLPKSEPLTKEELEKVAAVKFPGSKAKMLATYMEDGELPETIETKKQMSVSESASLADSEPVDVGDIPPDFLS